MEKKSNSKQNKSPKGKRPNFQKPKVEPKPFDMQGFINLWKVVKSGKTEMLQKLTEDNINQLLDHFGIQYTKFTSLCNKEMWLKSALDR